MFTEVLFLRHDDSRATGWAIRWHDVFNDSRSDSFLRLRSFWGPDSPVIQAVYPGEVHRWPGFQVRDGYWGTQFLSPMLYAMGNDTVTLRIVSGIWFGYAALIAAGLVVAGRLCFRRGGTARHGRNAESPSA